MANQKPKSRLGKGLSALINAPVPVAPPPVPDRQEAATSPDHATQPGGPQIRLLPIDSLHPNKYQPRQSFDEEALRRLAESIASSGMMQPIVARPSEGRAGGGGAAQWEIIAGERRWRAARLAGLSQAPVVVHDIDDRAAAEWALIENLQREDLNPIDRALAFRGLADEFQLTQSEIAQRVGLDRSSVANLMRILDLEPEVQSLIRAGRLTTGHAKALLALPSGDRRVKLANEAMQNQWSVRELEERVRLLEAAEAAPTPEKPGSRRAPIAPSTNELARQLSEHLGTKVELRTNAVGNKGRLIISFYSVEQVDGLLQRLGFTFRS